MSADTDPSSIPPGAAFQDVIHAEFLPDLADRLTSFAANRYHLIVQYYAISESNMIFNGIMVDGKYTEWNITEAAALFRLAGRTL